MDPLRMPRKIVPSPNEEAELVKRAQERQKIERLRAARSQAKGWSRKNGASYNQKLKQEEVEREKENLFVKIEKLSSKEKVLRKKLAESLAEVGDGYNAATKLLAKQLDEQKTLKMSEFSQKAKERHQTALSKLNEMKKEQELEDQRLRELRGKVLLDEEKRKQAILAAPRVPQPSMELPNHTLQHRPLRGLDAFTKTYYHLPGVGVVDEKSLGSVSDAKRLAQEEHERDTELQRKLQSAAQAREEQAEVRGYTALQKVQLDTILETVTAQLDKASLIDRAKRQRTADTMPTDIFASSLVRGNMLKQKQHSLEHAVEELFGYQEDRVKCVMKLPGTQDETIDTTTYSIDERLKDETIDTTTYSLDERLKDETIDTTTYSLDERLKDDESWGESPKQSAKLPSGFVPSRELDLNQSELQDKTAVSEEELGVSEVAGLSDLSVVHEVESRPSLALYFPLHDGQSLSEDNTTADRSELSAETSADRSELSAETSADRSELSVEQSGVSDDSVKEGGVDQSSVYVSKVENTLDHYTSILERKEEERDETLVMQSPPPVYISPDTLPQPSSHTPFTPHPETSQPREAPECIIIHSPHSPTAGSLKSYQHTNSSLNSTNSTSNTTMSDFHHSFRHTHTDTVRLNESVSATSASVTVEKIPGQVYTPYNPPTSVIKTSPAVYHEKDFERLSPKEKEETFQRIHQQMKHRESISPNSSHNSHSSNPASLSQHTLTPTNSSNISQTQDNLSKTSDLSSSNLSKTPSTTGNISRTFRDTISQHPLSDTTDFSVNSSDLSKVSSAPDSSISGISGPTGLSIGTLQEQLRRINGHLKEIEMLRDGDVSRS